MKGEAGRNDGEWDPMDDRRDDGDEVGSGKEAADERLDAEGSSSPELEEAEQAFVDDLSVEPVEFGDDAADLDLNDGLDPDQEDEVSARIDEQEVAQKVEAEAKRLLDEFLLDAARAHGGLEQALLAFKARIQAAWDALAAATVPLGERLSGALDSLTLPEPQKWVSPEMVALTRAVLAEAAVLFLPSFRASYFLDQLRGLTPAEVARAHGVNSHRVRLELARARRRLLRDPLVQALLVAVAA